MNKINFNQTGGFPLSTNILSTMQDDYNLYHNYKHLAGDNCIISGCEIIGSRVSDGVMVLNGELVPFIGGAIPTGSKVYIKEEVEKKTFEDASIKDVIVKRKAVIGTGEGAILFSNLTRVKPLVEIAKALVPKGMISMWSGKLEELPKGWYLCDGTKGTPDLRDRFIVGSGGKYTTGNTGGLDQVVLTEAQMPKHKHEGTTNSAGEHSHSYEDSYRLEERGYWRQIGIDGVTDIWNSKVDDGKFQSNSNGKWYPSSLYWRVNSTKKEGSHTHKLEMLESGSNQAHENRPPYYALAFIIYKGE